MKLFSDYMKYCVTAIVMKQINLSFKTFIYIDPVS